ncbi:MAG: hypothetical protein OXI79_11780 [Gammaproteobacteria bacterium]|nr:hypothetical protein [Gammaproteobacteria bacterium]
MPDNRKGDTILKWWMEGDTDGAEMVIEAMIRPVPRVRSRSGLATDAIVTLNGVEIAPRPMCLGENDAREYALAMARAAIGTLEQVHGRRGERQEASNGL